MQTFLPYPDFAASARVLDRARLGKQRVEVKQLLRALLPAEHPARRHLGGAGGSTWARHPAARMWRGHEGALACYGVVVCEEWRRRGYADTLIDQFRGAATTLATHPTAPTCDLPPWLGDDEFHASHRSNLLRKDRAHYGRFGWAEPPDLPYVWPG